jgi:hypothetical protein
MSQINPYNLPGSCGVGNGNNFHKGKNVSSQNESSSEEEIQNKSNQKLHSKKKKPFHKTKKGKIIIAVTIVGVLALAGGIAGLTYYLVTNSKPCLVEVT